MSWRLGQGQFHASRWASAPPNICSTSFLPEFLPEIPIPRRLLGILHLAFLNSTVHNTYNDYNVYLRDPVRKFLPQLGSMSLGGNYHVTDAAGSAFLKVGKPSVAGGIRGSNTHCFARLPGRKGFYHLEHVRKSQHWLGQQTAGLSAAYGGRGLRRLDSWDYVYVVNVFGYCKFPEFCFEFPSFWRGLFVANTSVEASRMNCLEVASQHFAMVRHNTEPDPRISSEYHLNASELWSQWDGLRSPVKSYG